MRLNRILLQIIFVSVSFMGTWSTQAYALNDPEKNVLRVQFIGQRVYAIENQMRMSLMNENHKEWRALSRNAIKDLQKASDDVINLIVDSKVEPLRSSLKDMIDALKDVYDSIEMKSEQRIDNHFQKYLAKEDWYLVLLKDKLNEYFKLDVSTDLHIRDIELKLFNNVRDQRLYEQSIDLIGQKKFKAAYSILQDLLKSYRGQAAEASIVGFIIDCFENTDSDLEEKSDSLALITPILDKNEYNLALYDLFIKWMTIYQKNYYGMSNISEIPNDQYNQRRWEIVQKIEKYLDKNPDDKWAKTQIRLLMDFPLIERGGPMGNTNLSNWVNLFSSTK